MSVNAGDRKEGKLTVLVKGRKLAAYTISICCNEKNFPVMYKNAITDKLIMLATDIFTKCWTANNIKVDMDGLKAAKRCDLQNDAHDECNELLALIMIAQQVFHLRTKRIKYWGEQVIEVRNLIQAWHDNDKKRYGDMFL